MRFKTLIAITLALLLVGTLAAPALAAPPAGAGKLNPLEDESGKGVYLLRVGPDNELILTIILAGALENTDYDWILYWGTSSSWSQYPTWITTDDNGNCRATIVSPPDFGTDVTLTFQLKLDRGDVLYEGEPVTISFK